MPDLAAAAITADMIAAAHDYDVAHRDDPGQPVRGRWWRPPDDQVRRLLTGAAPHLTAAATAAERQRLILAVRHTCACQSCKDAIADLLRADTP